MERLGLARRRGSADMPWEPPRRGAARGRCRCRCRSGGRRGSVSEVPTGSRLMADPGAPQIVCFGFRERPVPNPQPWVPQGSNQPSSCVAGIPAVLHSWSLHPLLSRAPVPLTQSTSHMHPNMHPHSTLCQTVVEELGRSQNLRDLVDTLKGLGVHLRPLNNRRHTLRRTSNRPPFLHVHASMARGRPKHSVNL